MYFLLLLLLFALLAAHAPRTWRVIEVLVLAPIVGVALGGFAWGIAAMFCSTLITWAAFGTFLAGGTLVSEIAFIKAR